MKTLIIYYSKDNTTRIVAETLSKRLKTDIIEIKDKKERNGFLNSFNLNFDAFREIKTEVYPSYVDLSNYDIVYFGTPVIAKKPSPAIITFIDNCDIQGKDVILFATMSKSGGKSTLDRLEEKVNARGGRVIERFSIKTGDKSPVELKRYSAAYSKMLDLNLYNQ